MANERRKRKESGCEDDRDNASGDEFHGENRADATIGGIAMDAFGVINCDDSLGFVEFDKEVNYEDERNDKTEGNPEISRIDGDIEPAEEGKRAACGVCEINPE